MRSLTSRRFRELFRRLPEDVQSRATRAYRLFRANPFHPGLHFKIVDDKERIYSVRLGLGYRALHAEYDRLL